MQEIRTKGTRVSAHQKKRNHSIDKDIFAVAPFDVNFEAAGPGCTNQSSQAMVLIFVLRRSLAGRTALVPRNARTLQIEFEFNEVSE